MEGGFFLDLFMGCCKLCVLLTCMLLLFFFVMLPYYIVRGIIDAFKGKPEGSLSDSFINFWSAHSDD